MQVVCSNCNQVSNQYENMMDLTVEIQGDASTLEECLEQFTVKEWLHGENMCNDYVKAWKRLTVRLAPNILTIALKRFRGGRFGKLNKKISFPETLDLNPYMSQSGDGRDIYKLYAVVVHLDLLNAAYFGHYVCYIKDFRGHWYKIDDEKVFHVELDEVLSQGAYMLLYRRGSARTSCLRPSKEDEQKVAEAVKEAQPASTPVEIFSNSGSMDSESDPSPKDSGPEKSSSLVIDPEHKREGPEDMDVDDPVSTLSISKEVNGNGYHDLQESTPAEHANGFVSHHVSSSKLCFNKSSNVQVDSLSADFIIEDGSGSTSSCATGAVPMVSSTENTMSLQNGVSGDDVVSPAMDDLDKLENGKVSPMPSCSRNSVGNIAKGEASSRTKLKPLFSPGFLEKRPRNKSVKREVKSLVQTYEYVSTCAATANDRGLGKLPGHEVKDEGISLMDSNDVVPSLHVLGEPDSCPNKDEKIDIHELDSTCNGEHSSETPAERLVDAGDEKFCDPNGICYNGSSSSYSQGQ
ncbi:Peptidase C19, ubiquitin carboxyl-terminal hydrolase [Dillenia turbinata]|uniref:Peptidase C19, ubiquitin carboxyl-terminal hydrolase n=1 Tax=Dillenia turbinata TaxID=194707 RepID=A0AAN8YWQ2_9MAGN